MDVLPDTRCALQSPKKQNVRITVIVGDKSYIMRIAMPRNEAENGNMAIRLRVGNDNEIETIARPGPPWHSRILGGPTREYARSGISATWFRYSMPTMSRVPRSQ